MSYIWNIRVIDSIYDTELSFPYYMGFICLNSWVKWIKITFSYEKSQIVYVRL